MEELLFQKTLPYYARSLRKGHAVEVQVPGYYLVDLLILVHGVERREELFPGDHLFVVIHLHLA